MPHNHILPHTIKQNYALLALQDGTTFIGTAIGSDGESVGEVVFNTSLTGYQEILTDPSYCGQMVTLTYPHIGNVGTNKIDEESGKIYAKALIIKDYSLIASNYRSTCSLSDYLKSQNIVAISNIDTRKLTRILRNGGAQSGAIITAKTKEALLSKKEYAIELSRQFKGLNGLDLAKVVSTPHAYEWLASTERITPNQSIIQPQNTTPYHVVAYDFGIKHNILRMLTDRGCKVTVVPAQTPAETVLNYQPDGIFLSNGPGDPAPCDYAIRAIKTFLETDIPIFGICLGHQLLALASGAKTVKMKFGHHGGNHPVKDIPNDRVMITAQNHNFAVDESTLPDLFDVTHRSLFDHTLQGIHHKLKPAFSFQGHPEASPGPHDAAPLFDHFIELMQHHQHSNPTKREF